MKKQLVIVGIAVLLICVGLSGCQNNNTEKSGSTDADGDGWSDEEEQQYGTDPNDPNNYPLDTDGDHIPDSVDTDDDNDGYLDTMELSYGTDPKDNNSFPLDTDKDGIPDYDSADGSFIGDQDDDDDGLIDVMEIQLGSDPKNESDVTSINIEGTTHYLVDTNMDGESDMFYNSVFEIDTSIYVTEDGKYRIDSDDDGVWDYIYDPLTKVVLKL
jgi:hypothetical protein